MKALVSYKALLNVFCFSVDLIIVDELSLPRNIQGESQGTLGRREVNPPLKIRVFISFPGALSEVYALSHLLFSGLPGFFMPRRSNQLDFLAP